MCIPADIRGFVRTRWSFSFANGFPAKLGWPSLQVSWRLTKFSNGQWWTLASPPSPPVRVPLPQEQDAAAALGTQKLLDTWQIRVWRLHKMLYMCRYTIWTIAFICYVALYNDSSCPMKAALQWKMRSIHHWCAKNCRALKAEIPHPCSLLWSHIWIYNTHTIREPPLLFLWIFNYKSGFS